MKLTIRTSGIIIIILVLFIVTASIISNVIILNGYKKIENEKTTLLAQRVLEAYRVEEENLVTKTSDWSNWNDSYQYIQDNNEAFQIANLQPETLENLRLNVIVFADKTGTLISSYGYNIQTQTPQDISSYIIERIQPGNILLASHDDDIKSGLLHTPDGPLLFTSQPIKKTNGDGPFMGTVIFAKYFDQTQITRLAAITKSNLTGYYSLDTAPEDYDIATQLAAEEGTIVLTTPSEKEIIADFHVHTIDNEPGIFFRVSSPRDIYALGTQTGVYLTIVLSLLGILAVGIVIVLLELLVLSPLQWIQRELRRIQQSGISSERLSTMNMHDEFLLLTNDINNMLDSVNNKIIETKKLNSLMVGRELAMEKLKQKNRELEKQLHSSV